MKTFGILALFGAAAGFLLCTPRGRQITRDTGEKLRDGCERLQERFGMTPEVERTVENALAQPHPDTPVARAFESAIG
jgi:hypothetical protein